MPVFSAQTEKFATCGPNIVDKMGTLSDDVEEPSPRPKPVHT